MPSDVAVLMHSFIPLLPFFVVVKSSHLSNSEYFGVTHFKHHLASFSNLAYPARACWFVDWFVYGIDRISERAGAARRPRLSRRLCFCHELDHQRRRQFGPNFFFFFFFLCWPDRCRRSNRINRIRRSSSTSRSTSRSYRRSRRGPRRFVAWFDARDEW